MRWIGRVLAGGIIFLSAGGRAIADAPQPVAAFDSAPPSMTAVLFAPSRPIFLQITVQVDGASLEVFRAQFAAGWFGRLDKDKDGTLNETESAEFPALVESGTEPSDRKIWPELDVDPADGKCSSEEFRKFLDRRLGPPLAVTARKKTGNTAAGLFERLDRNHDRALAGDELSAARDALVRLDANDDETISVAELAAGDESRPAAGLASAASQQLPLAVVGFGATAESILGQLLPAYDGRAKPPADGALDAAELGLPSESLLPFDADKNGKLDSSELVRMIADAPTRTKLSVQLFHQQRGRAKVVAEPAAAELPWEITAEGVSAKLDTFQISINARRTRSSAGDSRSFYALRFRVIDKDRNNYLDATEFAKLDLTGAEFKGVDADGNGQITAEELAGFVGKQELAPLNQVVMEVTDESRSLFDLLDTRTDGRLSRRELISAAARLAEVDGDKDGRVSAGELTTRVSVEIGVKRPTVDRGAMRVVAPPNTAASATVSRDRGPEWFLRMDRNYDGDVSIREFLGTRAAFDRFDVDHDGLLSPEEAEKAK